MDGTVTYSIVAIMLAVVFVFRHVPGCVIAIPKVQLALSLDEDHVNLLSTAPGHVLCSNVITYSNTINSSC